MSCRVGVVEAPWEAPWGDAVEVSCRVGLRGACYFPAAAAGWTRFFEVEMFVLVAHCQL